MSSIAASAASSLAVVCGPTGAGKSALALRLAEEVGAAIISADSRQVYRGFDIGTAKPTASERDRVPHFGIDVAEPVERYSSAKWASGFPAWSLSARSLGRTPMVVGGTGFYLRTLVQPLFEEPEFDPSRRKALEPELAALSSDELRRWVERLDPARAHLGRAQLLRAVETALLTGERISDLHVRHARAPVVTARYLLVDPGPALQDAIVQRVDDMLAAGWLDEVRGLLARLPGDAPAWTASGYDVLRTVAADGAGAGLAAAREKVIIETRQYAKRQRTWFRHQLKDLDVTTLDPRDRAAFDRAMAWWNGDQ